MHTAPHTLSRAVKQHIDADFELELDQSLLVDVTYIHAYAQDGFEMFIISLIYCETDAPAVEIR